MRFGRITNHKKPNQKHNKNDHETNIQPQGRKPRLWNTSSYLVAMGFVVGCITATFSGGKTVLSLVQDNQTVDGGYIAPNEQLSNVEAVLSSVNVSSTAQTTEPEVAIQVDPPTQSQDSVHEDVSIKIDISSSTSSSGTETENTAGIVLNGEQIELPDNGRVRQTIRDENGTTRIRADIDSDSSSNISISTEVDEKGGN